MKATITSYDNSTAGSGSVLNQCQYEYNDFSQLITEYHAQGGSVNTSTTPKVEYGYADGSANTIRPTSLTYPDGRELRLDYGTAGGMNDLIGRVAALVDDDDTPLAEYQFLGLGAVVRQDSPEADLRYTLVNPAGTNDPDTGDIYSGLDRFGRVKDVRWRDVSAASDLSRVQYGYDRASNRTFRRNPTDTANHHDWLYGYDGLHRLQDAQRGTLNGGRTAITSPEFAQCWTLDPTGNWQGFRQADSGDPWDLVQARLANPVNEITGITNSTGPASAQPAYDGAGNMTTIPQPNDPTESYTATYDAWNRLVKLVDPATGHTVQENEYDGRGFRTVRKSYTAGVLTETRHFYYTDGWRDVEERLGTNPDTADPDRQFVWGLRYIDDLVLRDRSDAGTLDERLYACQDANWNVTAVVDDAGAVQERYEYDPYGKLTVLSPDFVVTVGSSFGWETTYAGYRWDAIIGFCVVRFRWLTTTLGTFIVRDPVGYVDSTALTAYAIGAPLSHVDPVGLQIEVGGPYWAYPPPTLSEIHAQDIRNQEADYRAQIISALTERRDDYLQCACTRNPNASASEFDEAAAALADAYLDCMYRFLRNWSNPTPAHGQAPWYWPTWLSRNPWCGDYSNFFFGGNESGQGCLDEAISNSPLIRRYFALHEGQWHGSMTADTPQHNFGIIYPVGCIPRLSNGIPMSYNSLTSSSAGSDVPMQSSDPNMLILDPWLHVRPEVFGVDSHHYPPSNCGDINITPR